MLSFNFLFMKKTIHTRLLFVLEWDSRWPLCKLVQHSSLRLTSPILIISHSNLVSQSLASGIQSSFNSVLILYVAIFSLLTILDSDILDTPCSLPSLTTAAALGIDHILAAADWGPCLCSSFHAGVVGLHFHVGQHGANCNGYTVNESFDTVAVSVPNQQPVCAVGSPAL